LLLNTHLVDSGRDVVRAKLLLNRVTPSPIPSAVSLVDPTEF